MQNSGTTPATKSVRAKPVIRWVVVCFFIALVVVVIARKAVETHQQIRSLSDAVVRLRKDGFISSDSQPMVPPIGISRLGYVEDRSSPGLHHLSPGPCFLIGRRPERTQSYKSLEILYQDGERLAAELTEEKASASGSVVAVVSGRAALVMSDLFEQSSEGVFDPTSGCSGEIFQLVTHEWGAKDAILSFDSDIANSGRGNGALLNFIAKASGLWTEISKGRLKAEQLIIAYATRTVMVSASAVATTESRDAITRGSLVQLPVEAQQLSIAVKDYDRRRQDELWLRITGPQSFSSSCSFSKDGEGHILKLRRGDYCSLFVGTASSMGVRFSVNNEQIPKIETTWYQTKTLPSNHRN